MKVYMLTKYNFKISLNKSPYHSLSYLGCVLLTSGVSYANLI